MDRLVDEEEASTEEPEEEAPTEEAGLAAKLSAPRLKARARLNDSSSFISEDE